MGKRYFVDTWYFIALVDTHDAHHRRVVGLSRLVEDAELVTHDAVLTEMLAFFSEEGGRIRGVAVRSVRRTLERMEVVSSSDLFLPALDRYEARPDKEYSLVDCMSMVLMEQRGIHQVLTNDHHFAQAGFTVVSQ